jgi:hypothetical protein
MPDTGGPPRKFYGFKPKEFEAVNTLIGQSRPSAAHDVFAIRREVEEAERAAGLHQLEVKPPKRSKRKRDYWRLVVGLFVVINVMLVVIAWGGAGTQTLAAGMTDQFWPVFRGVLFGSPILAWGFAGWCVMSASIAWLMFGVMDDY